MSKKDRILIVDDDPDIRELLSQSLNSDLFEIALAENGEETLRMVGQQKPDLIILDIMMPGIDGLEVCRRLKENPATSNIPVLMLTAKSGVGDKIEGFVTGAEEYITKPFDPMNVEARVATILRRVKRERAKFQTGVQSTKKDGVV
ncbi:response regulator [Candidatus Desantisbacteria bacterium]|nr:response regulator [Candidatus Desantisbacteria bacterium]